MKFKSSKPIAHLIEIYKKYNFRKKNKVTIEIHATDHCNLKCSSCSHYSPLAKPKFADLVVLQESLKKLSPFEETIKKIRVVGGEPLLNKQICQIFEIVHKYCPNVQLEMTTNGILIPKIDKSFFSFFREYDILINITQYPLKKDVYENIEDILIKEQVKYNLSTLESTLNKWNKIKLHECKFPVLKSKIHFLKKSQCDRMCIQLVEDRLFPCNVSAYSYILNNAFGTKFIHRKDDYLEIDKIKSSKDIRKLLYKSHPFCSYHYQRFNHYNWRPSQRKKEEWVLD